MRFILCCLCLILAGYHSADADGNHARVDKPVINRDQTAAIPPGKGRPQNNDADKQEMQDIHDIKPEAPMGINPTPIYWILAVAALTGLALLIYLRQKRRLHKKPDINEPVVSPDQSAYMLLDRLSAQDDIDGKAFYFELSAILRGYIEARFGVRASEMTTEELIPNLEPLKIEKTLKEGVKILCRNADPIKFADRSTVQSQMDKDLLFIREFIRFTTAEPEKEMN